MSDVGTKVGGLSAKAKSVLELVVEGKTKDEIKEELEMKQLAYASITKKLIKEGLCEEDGDELVVVDGVADALGAEPAEEKPAPKKAKAKAKAKAEPEAEDEAVEEEDEPEAEDEAEIDEQAVFDDLNRIFEGDEPIESEDDVKGIVKQKGFLTAEDAKEMSSDTLLYVETVAKKVKVTLPWKKEEKKAKGKAAQAKGKEKAKAKAKKDTVPTSELGSREGSQAYEIDMCILGKKKMTIAEIADACGVKAARVNLHVNHLRKKKGFTIESDKNGKLTYTK